MRSVRAIKVTGIRVDDLCVKSLVRIVQTRGFMSDIKILISNFGDYLIKQDLSKNTIRITLPILKIYQLVRSMSCGRIKY